MPWLVCPILILNIVSASRPILYPLVKVIGMVGLRTSFILSSRSWEIGSPTTGGAGHFAGKKERYILIDISVINYSCTALYTVFITL